MDLEAVKGLLEPPRGGDTAGATALPARFFEAFVLHGISLDLIQQGHLICSMIVPHRLLNSSGVLHGGLMVTLVDLIGSAVFYSAGLRTSGVSLEISISFVDVVRIDEEIEFDTKILKVGEAIAVSTVDIRKKKTGKMVAQARHTKYIAVFSKL